MDLAEKMREIYSKKEKTRFYFKTCRRCKNNFHSTRKRSKICWECDKRPTWYREKKQNATEAELEERKAKLLEEYKELI